MFEVVAAVLDAVADDVCVKALDDTAGWAVDGLDVVGRRVAKRRHRQLGTADVSGLVLEPTDDHAAALISTGSRSVIRSRT